MGTSKMNNGEVVNITFLPKDYWLKNVHTSDLHQTYIRYSYDAMNIV